MFTLPPNTAASMLLQKSLSRLMSLHDLCTQPILSSCSQPGVVQTWIASTLYAQGFRGLCTTEHRSRRTWEGTWQSKFRVCFLTVNKTADVFSSCTAWWGACLPAMQHSLADSPILRCLRLSQDCLLLPSLPLLPLLLCLAQSGWPLYGFFNASFSITWIILPGLA